MYLKIMNVDIEILIINFTSRNENKMQDMYLFLW